MSFGILGAGSIHSSLLAVDTVGLVVRGLGDLLLFFSSGLLLEVDILFALNGFRFTKGLGEIALELLRSGGIDVDNCNFLDRAFFNLAFNESLYKVY